MASVVSKTCKLTRVLKLFTAGITTMPEAVGAAAGPR
jgi:hypothetical protein